MRNDHGPVPVFYRTQAFSCLYDTEVYGGLLVGYGDSHRVAD